MKTPTVKFILSDITEIARHDADLTSRAHIERAVRAAVALAERMARKGRNYLGGVLNKNTTNQKQNAWNADPAVKAFFGVAPGKAGMQDTYDRLDRVYTRLRDKSLTIRLKPQAGTDVNGHNYGGPLSPRQFVLFPRWFAKDEEPRAAIVIHELLHDWHIDHKVVNPSTGRRETAYGTVLAKELAKQNPGSARKNPENFEQFCLAVWG